MNPMQLEKKILPERWWYETEMSKVKNKERNKEIYFQFKDCCWRPNQKSGIQEVFRLLIFTLCMMSFKKRGLGWK